MSREESPISSDIYKYVVGIDFGTTFSGAGYIFIKGAGSKEVYDIRQWQSNRNLKVPTIIRYHKKNKNVYKCGAEVTAIRPAAEKEYGPTIRLFKLLLDKSHQGVPPLPEGISIVKAISDYLRYLYENIVEEIMSTPTNSSQTSTIRYCLSIPAMWDIEAKAIMREAAIRAGIVNKEDHPERLLLIGEAEAAALYSEKMHEGIRIKSNETFMVCDAGGGTIDIVTYRKKIKGQTKSFQQLTIAYGAVFGSAQVDRYFREYVWRMIKKEVCSLPNIEQRLDAFEKDFRDNIKPNFGDGIKVDSDKSVYLDTPPQLADLNIFKGDFKMSGGMLEIGCKALEPEAFEPVVSEVLTVIRSQLRELKNIEIKLDYIIVVGGFAQSHYLNQKIRGAFEKEVKGIVVPNEGALAVSRGAVFFGLNPYTISHRLMKATYGLGISAPFKDGIDRADFKVVDKANKAFCKNRFDVCAKKGQNINLAEGIKRPYYTFNSDTCHIKLYCFKGDIIPRYVSNDADAAQKGEMAFKIAHFVLQLPERLVGGSRKIDFNFEIFFGHMEIKLVVNIPGEHEKPTYRIGYENEGNITRFQRIILTSDPNQISYGI